VAEIHLPALLAIIGTRFPNLDQRITGQKLCRRIIRMNDRSNLSREEIADLIEALGDSKERTSTIRGLVIGG
jgi:hypothetical protein